MLNKVNTISKLASRNYSEFNVRQFGKQFVLETGNQYASKYEGESEICTHKSSKVFDSETLLLKYLERRI